MATQKQLDYNRKSSADLGWTPSWFGALDFDDDLIESIKRFQQAHGLTADGLCGPGTYRRLFTSREADLQVLEPSRSSIVYNGEFYPI